MARRAVFLDRDGVLNRAVVVDGKPFPPADSSRVRLVAGAKAGCRKLKQAGFLLIGVTNQPDVARGRTPKETVEEINRRIARELDIDEFRVCYHDDGDACSCRKPEPGMLLEAARSLSIDLASSYMVGDRWKDIEAGNRAGCTTVFIDYHYREEMKSSPVASVANFTSAVRWILQDREPREQEDRSKS